MEHHEGADNEDDLRAKTGRFQSGLAPNLAVLAARGGSSIYEERARHIGNAVVAVTDAGLMSSEQRERHNVLGASVEQLKACLEAVDIKPWSADDKMVLRVQMFIMLGSR